MNDLISRQASIDALCHVDEYNGRSIEAIMQLPPAELGTNLAEVGTVDDMQIVRCKDCKYAEYIDDVQTLWCTECGQGRTVAPYDFCSYGERREDG